MAKSTARDGAGSNQLTVDYRRQQLMLFGANTSQKREVFKNDSGAELVLSEGRILARIAVAGDDLGKLVVLDAAASDGTEKPVGIYCGREHTLAADAEWHVLLVVGGSVNENVVAASEVGNPALDSTIIAAQSLRDHLQAIGLKLVKAESLDELDN